MPEGPARLGASAGAPLVGAKPAHVPIPSQRAFRYPAPMDTERPLTEEPAPRPRGAPPSLRQRTLSALEWPRIQQGLAERARSPLGRAKAATISPYKPPVPRAHGLARILEAKDILAVRPGFHGLLSDTHDPRPFFERAQKQGVLEPTQIHACGHFMAITALLRTELHELKGIPAASLQRLTHKSSVTDLAPLLGAELAELPKKPALVDVIHRSVTSGGEILDSASVLLAELRAQRASKRAGMEKYLQGKVNDWHRDGFLQDSFYDVLDGRYVVPLRADRATSIGGTLHSRSQSRQSLYIEPTEFMEANNELQELELKIHAEEWRVLQELSRKIAAEAPLFAPWVEPLALLDYYLAAAQLAGDWHLHAPEENGALNLKHAFHPLLPLHGVTPVRNTLKLAEAGAAAGMVALILSGPNTGGKTVLIKAVALTTLMAKAGLPIPADEGSSSPEYSDVLALIGDEQAIEEGLSSFSAQIKDLKEALTLNRKPALIIIDEILSSTDPEEAAALAQAVMEELAAKGHHVLITTHFSALSARCRGNPQIGVGAMEFKNGEPTYHFHVGEQGSSHALDIAQRLGFPKRVIERARSLISTERVDYERAKKALHAREHEMKQELTSVERDLYRSHAARVAELEKERQQLTARYDDYVAESERRLEESLSTLKSRLATYERLSTPVSPKRAEESARLIVKETASTLAAEAKRAKKEASAPRRPVEAPAAPLSAAVGAIVRLPAFGNGKGRIIALDGETATIQLGALRLQKTTAEFVVVEGPKAPVAPSRAPDIETAALPSSTLDLRGRRLDEAMSEAGRFLDLAYRSRAPFVKIVTGHGTGAVKNGLKELVRGLPYVREFKPERPQDDGAFLVEFDH